MLVDTTRSPCIRRIRPLHQSSQALSKQKSIMSSPAEKKDVVVVGGGLVGSMAAAYMALRGSQVDVYEGRPDSRTAELVQGRSINLALSERGLNALDRLGLKEKMIELGVPMYGRMMHSVSGKLTFQQYGRPGQYILSVPRRDLNELLMNRAEETGNVSFHFEKKCREVNVRKGYCVFGEKTATETVEADCFLACDGAFSKVRSTMQRMNRFQYQQRYITHGYKELTIPPVNGEYALDPNCLHIWPRHEYMLIALPNKEGKDFTCTLFLPFENAKFSFEDLKTPDDVLTFFRQEFPDTLSLIPKLTEEFFANPTGSLVTVRCSPHTTGKFLLMGDAAHAIVPFYGQGVNAGFEDVFFFDGLLERHMQEYIRANNIDRENPNIQEIVAAVFRGTSEEYSGLRKPHTDAIADLALYNFLEMQSHTAKPMFLLRRKLERAIHRIFPNSFIPLYSMVSFSNIPYADVIEKSKQNDKILSTALTTAVVAAGVGLWKVFHRK